MKSKVLISTFVLFAVIGGYGLTHRSIDVDVMGMNEAEAVNGGMQIACAQGAETTYSPDVKLTMTPAAASASVEAAPTGTITVTNGINGDLGGFNAVTANLSTHTITISGKAVYFKQTGKDCQTTGLQSTSTVATATAATALGNSATLKFSTTGTPATGVGNDFNTITTTVTSDIHKATTGVVGTAAIANGSATANALDIDDGTNTAVNNKNNSIAGLTGMVMTFNADSAATAVAKTIGIVATPL